MKAAKIGLKLNVTYQLKDKYGNIKPLFQENTLFRFLIKRGILSPLAFKIPFLFGSYSQEKIVANLVTNAGKAGVAGLIIATGHTNAFDYIAVGIGTTAAALGDTALESEITDSGMARVSATLSRVTTDVTNDTSQLTTTFSVSGTKAITESGVLDSSSVGVLLARQVFPSINVVNGDSLTITWKIDVD